MKHLVFGLLLFLCLSIVSAFDRCSANPIDDNCPSFVVYGAPISELEDGQYLCRMAYAVHYNFNTKTAEYVVEHITKAHLTGTAKRKNNFHEDIEIATEHRATLKDFRTGSKTYDRGHMAPAQDFKYSTKAMSQSFLLSNMVPQLSGNNRGIWAHLEQRVVNLTRRVGETYVISGPIYHSGGVGIGDGLMVPQLLFKIVFEPKTGTYAAFILPNLKLPVDSLADYAVSISSVEKMTGLQLFPNGSIDKETIGILDLMKENKK